MHQALISQYEFLQIIVTIKESAEGHGKMKELVRKTGIPLVREKLAQYIKELKEGNFLYLNYRQCFVI